jgi:hypothetical protein
MLTGDITSLQEPRKIPMLPQLWFCLPTNPNKSDMKGEESLDPTQKLKLPNIRSISRSRFAKSGIMVHGCGRKPMVPKDIWLPSIIELLRDECEKTVELMIQMPRSPQSTPIDEGSLGNVLI